MRRVATLLCVGLIGCASPRDDAPVGADSPARDTASAESGGRNDEPSLDAAGRPPADPDVAHFIQVENDGEGLRATDGSADEGGWAIRYRVVNPTEPSVYLVGCNNPPRPQLQKWLAGAWKPVQYVMDDACRSPAWEIRGGGALPEAPEWSEVRVVYDPGRHPGTEGDTTRRGTYRLVLALFTDDPDVALASATQIVGRSTPFEIDGQE